MKTTESVQAIQEHELGESSQAHIDHARLQDKKWKACEIDNQVVQQWAGRGGPSPHLVGVPQIVGAAPGEKP